MVPLVKGYSTEMSLEVTSLGVQVHGGMGFIEETGAAQYYRDAKILTIYEGTTAIRPMTWSAARPCATVAACARAGAADRGDGSELGAGSAAAQAVGQRLRAAREAHLAVVDFSPRKGKANPTRCTPARCPT